MAKRANIGMYGDYGEHAHQRIDVNLKLLRKMVDACDPEALNQVKETAQMVKSKRVTGDISSWDYRIYNKEVDKQIDQFLKKCTCRVVS